MKMKFVETAASLMLAIAAQSLVVGLVFGG